MKKKYKKELAMIKRMKFIIIMEMISPYLLWLSILPGMNYLLFTKIGNMPLKIILLVVFNLLLFALIFIWLKADKYFAKKANKEGFCIFLNDMRLFNGMTVNPDAWYKDTYFCSVSDPIQGSFEFVNGLSRRVSATNQFLHCCIHRGERCPIFQNYSLMSENQLESFYASKWFTGY